MALMTMLASPVSGRIVGHRGPRLPLVVAGACLMTACAMLTGIDPVTPFTWLFAAYVVFGLGFGLVNAPITNAAVSGMPRAQAGVASAIASTSRQIGQTLGVAVCRRARHLPGRRVGARRPGHGQPRRPGGSSPAVAPWSLLLGFVATSRWALATAQRTAAELNPENLTVQPVAA